MTNSRAREARKPWWKSLLLTVMLLAIIALAGVGGWLYAQRSGAEYPVGEPTIMSERQVHRLAAERGPLYWAGSRPDTKLEVTVTTKNGVFIRYLPQSAHVGAKQKYLTVAT
ncbi:MAG TPA: hypothetical protein VM093_05830, partial [Aeromicrobium sp.]|nr:hypothetical protein [Aeromicrobium sp.]